MTATWLIECAARLMARTGLVNNIRRGFATNSSSSHSFVFFNSLRPGHDSLTINDSEAPDFGRRRYTLTTLGEKLLYAMIQAFAQLRLGREAADIAVARDRFGHLFPEFADRDDMYALASRGSVYDQWTRVTPEFMDAVRDPRSEIWGDSDASERVDDLRIWPDDDASDWDTATDRPNAQGERLGIVRFKDVWDFNDYRAVDDEHQAPA